MEDLLRRVSENAERPPAQTALHRKLPVYMPPAAQEATHVYTKKPKKSPLGPVNDGPFPIKERIGKSSLKLGVGHYANGRERTEIRHWRTCYPADVPEGTQDASRPQLGRKSKNKKINTCNKKD